MLLLQIRLQIMSRIKVVITYDEAVQRAIENTTSIASIDEAVDLMEKNKEDLFTSLEGFFLMLVQM